MSTIYSKPEEYGLVVVDEIDYYDGGYGFDLRVVWRSRETGKLYTARDAGCSCPSPFEDYGSLADLDELVNMVALREEVRSEKYPPHQEAQTFLDKIARALRHSKERNR